MRKSKSLLYVALFTVLFLTTIVLLFCSCSAEKRFNRLVKNHPELVDTTKKKVTKPILVIKTIDQGKLDSLSEEYKRSLDSAKANVEIIIQKEPCAELGNKIKSNINNLNKSKKQIDTVYIDAKCEILPFTTDTLGMSIKVSYIDGKSLISVTSKQANIVTCEESKFWQFKEFWIVVILLIFAIYFKVK